MTRIGLISDTHGLLRPEAVDVLRGSDFIVHAGDIGEGVLEPLATLAPVTAVRGNNDRGPWAERIPETARLRIGRRHRRRRQRSFASPQDRAPRRRAVRQPRQRRPGALQPAGVGRVAADPRGRGDGARRPAGVAAPRSVFLE
jgi:hypothetical protein